MSKQIDLEKLRHEAEDMSNVSLIHAVNDLIDLIAALEKENASLKQDAVRYQWLRVQPDDATAPRIDICHWTCEDGDNVNTGYRLRGEDADQAIDTAMLAGKQPAMEASNA